jgi:hypothetical protein
MSASRLFQDSLARRQRSQKQKSTARDVAERNEWELRLASASKLSIPSLRRRLVPFQARSLAQDADAMSFLQFSVAHHFPSFSRSRLRAREEPSSNSGDKHCVLSKRQKKQTQVLAAQFRPRTGIEGMVDGVPAFQQASQDMSSAKPSTPHSSITTFYDRAGQF